MLRSVETALAWFNEATFKGAARFSKTTFKGDAGFGQATFGGVVWFAGATFERSSGFKKATFEDIQFDEATFEGDARFNHAAFKGVAKFSKATFETEAKFSQATFGGRTEFNEATFKGDAGFGQATFGGVVWFTEATFEGDAGFGGARFEDDAWFTEATFEGDADFGWATFKSSTGFNRATFQGYAGFGGARFGVVAWFAGATFEGCAGFAGATFKSRADFAGAVFKGDAWFGKATFEGDAGFGGARFEGDVPVLGPLVAEGQLDLDGVQFTSAVRIETDAGGLSCRRGRFPSGVRFDLQRAVVRLDDSDLSVPSLLTGPPVSSPIGIGGRPKLLSLQGANVAGLALGNVGLADCRFAGAHNLDKLRVEADTVFGFSPAVAGWERRQVIAEETAWRAARTRPGRWRSLPWPNPEDQPKQFSFWPDPEDQPKPLSPGTIAGLYRALRKGREDAKDEPGAADFYYGEMEMRRHDRGMEGANRWRGRASRIVLTAYWLVSGYGQRAWRSLVALAAVTALFAVAFHYIGFTTLPKPASYWTSLLYTFRSTISLTDSQVVLTAWGSFFQALLRITGPVLLGLTLLALRSRVKR